MQFNVLWIRYDDKFKCRVGYLSYDGIWEFNYDEEGLSVATKLGFVGFPEFPRMDVTYQSKHLFDTFDSRIRRIDDNISEEEKFRLLEENQGVLVTDNIIIKKNKLKVKGW